MTVKYILTTLTLTLTLTSPILAQSPSPTSATIRDSVKQQVEQELSEIKSTVTKKAYVGTVSGKSDGTITLTSLTNLTRSVMVTADAAIKLTSGRDGTPADIKTGDFIIAMGTADGSGTLTVKRLLVTAKPPADSRQTIYGTVTKVSSSSLTVKTSDGKQVTARLLASTKYTGSTKASDIKADSKVVFITTGTTALSVIHLHLFP